MNTITTVLNFLFPLITFPYVSRVLSPTGYGTAEFALSTAQLFALVALLGVNTYGARECAKVRDDKDALSKTFWELVLVVSVWAIIVTVAFYLVALSVPRFAAGGTSMLVAGMLIPLSVIGVQWFMSANEQYAFMTIRGIVVKIVVVIAMFALVRTESDVVAWVAIWILSSSVAGVLNFVFAIRNIERQPLSALDWRRHLKPLLMFFLMVAAISIYTSLDSVMLGYMATDADVGYYSVAVKIKNVFTAIIGALSSVIVPRATYYLAKGKSKDYTDIVNISVRAASLYSAFAVPAGILYADVVINVLAGSAYVDSIAVLIAIMPAVAFISFTQVTSAEILTPKGKEKTLAITYGIAGIIDLVLNLLLIPNWLALGAAMSTTIAECFVFVAQVAIVARNESIRLYLAGCLRLLPVSGASIVVLIAGRALLGGSLLEAIVSIVISFLVLCVGLVVVREPLMLDMLCKIGKVRR